MKIKVLYFASAREVSGKTAEDLEVPSPCTVADLKVILSDRCRDLNFDKNKIKVAVNKRYSDDSIILKDTDEVALIPPIAGG